MSSAEIDARNARLFELDEAMVDLRKLGPILPRAHVLQWMKATGAAPALPQVDSHGHDVSQQLLDAVIANTNESSVPSQAPIRYGLAARRTILRSFPTTTSVYPSKDLLDFDSFAGGVLFPGDPVVVAHVSADAKWLLVVTEEGLSSSLGNDTDGATPITRVTAADLPGIRIAAWACCCPETRASRAGVQRSNGRRLQQPIRTANVMHAQVGDLLVVPGHVMMSLGKVNGQPYVIQDVPFAVFHHGQKTQWTKINEVSVTPLLPLLADESHLYVDAMTSLVHVTER